MSAHSETNPEPQGAPLPAEWLDFVHADSASASALGASVEELSDHDLALRLRVLEASEGPPSALEPEALAGRLAALRRAAAQVRALDFLGSKAAPPELEGLVVASLHTGARQDRAVRQVEALTPQSAPRGLDESVARLVIGEGRGSHDQTAPRPTRAPDVLDRLVAEALADPAKANAKSMTSRLGRQEAPEELAERVESQLVKGDRRTESPQDASDEPIGVRSVAAALVSMGLAVALVVTIGLRGNRQAAAPTTSPEQGLPAEVASTNDAPGTASERVAHVRLEVIMLNEDNLSEDDRRMLRLLGGAL